MTAIEITNAIHQAIKISYLIDYIEETDTLIFKYIIGATPYTMEFKGITDIKTKKELNNFINVIQSDIAYHQKEQEQEKE